MLPILWISQSRAGKVKWPTEGHQAEEGEGWDLNPDLPDLTFAFSALAGSLVQWRPGRPDGIAPAFSPLVYLPCRQLEEVSLR